MPNTNNPGDEDSAVQFIKRELDQIRRLLDKGTSELEHGKLSQAHEALLAARRIFEQLAGHVANWSGEHGGEQRVFTLQLAQADQAIARSERRLAAYVTK